MILSQKSIDEFKEIFESESGKKLSDAEASEAAHNLVNFYDLLHKIASRDFQLKKRLKKKSRMDFRLKANTPAASAEL